MVILRGQELSLVAQYDILGMRDRYEHGEPGTCDYHDGKVDGCEEAQACQSLA